MENLVKALKRFDSLETRNCWRCRMERLTERTAIGIDKAIDIVKAGGVDGN